MIIFMCSILKSSNSSSAVIMKNLGVELMLDSDISSHPRCAHGPTLLFERFTKDGKKSGQQFYACSACRNRKDCRFFRWKDEKLPQSENWYKEDKHLELSHAKYMKKMKQFLKLPIPLQKFCKNCSLFLLPAEHNDHTGHDVCCVTEEQLKKPSYLLLPIENSKKEAQFLFSEKAVHFLVECMQNLGYKKIVCIGTPRIHEYIHHSEELKLSSILLDIDKRYKQFYSADIFCHYNIFNHHFFDEKGARVFHDFLISRNKELVIIIDPPFGGLVDAIACTLKKMSSMWQKIVQSNDDIPILWTFPYFLESRLINAMASLSMLDYKVDYDNHPLFHDGQHGRKQGSPVRIFTNLKPKLFKFPKEEGYRYCKICKRDVSKENKHCAKCGSCTSKDGRPYKHCDKCNHCVKNNHFHCNKCNICALPDHQCEKLVGTVCHRCGKSGHKRKNCINDSLSKRKKLK